MIKVLDLRHRETLINEKRIIKVEAYNSLNVIYFDNNETLDTYSTFDDIIEMTRDEEVKAELKRRRKMSLKELNKEVRGA